MDTEHVRTVHCFACSKIVILSEDAGPGDVAVCPFCETKLKLEELCVLVTRPVEDG
jgi:hypothetical protein